MASGSACLPSLGVGSPDGDSTAPEPAPPTPVATGDNCSLADGNTYSGDDDSNERAAIAAFEAGEARLGSGDAKAALLCFMRAATALPGWPDAWQHLGVCFHRLQRFEQACAAMRHGLEVGRWEEPSAMLTYMDTLRELGRLGELEAVARRLSPDSNLAHFAALLAGGAAQARDGAKAAAPWFERALALQPANLLYTYLFAQAAVGEHWSAFCSNHLALPDAAEEDCDELFVHLQRAQHHLDAPTLRTLNDKVELHRLLVGASFWPEGYILPHQRAHAEAAESAAGGGTRGAARWVRKCRAGMGGLGVVAHATASDAVREAMVARRSVDGKECEEEEEESLLQTYVYPPVLLDGRKFSLRVFLVIYLGSPAGEPIGFMAQKGLALLAPRPWEWCAEDVGDAGMHLTNQSGSQTFHPDEELTRDIADLAELDLDGWPGGVEAIWASAEAIGDGLLSAARTVLQAPLVDFHPERAPLVPKILGLDLLLSAEAGGHPARVWLLEVNRHPSLGERYACARRVKRSVIVDAWRLLWIALGVDSKDGCGCGGAPGMPSWPDACGCLRRVHG